MYFSLVPTSTSSYELGGINKYGFVPMPLNFPSYGLGAMDNNSLLPPGQGCLDLPSLDAPRRALAAASNPASVDLRSKKQEHIPRPRNAFIIFRSQFASQYKARQPHPHQNLVSRDAAEAWKALSEEEKLPYKLQADGEKREHRRKYPNYIYMPGGKTKRSSQASARRPSKPYSPPLSRKVNKAPQTQDYARSSDEAQRLYPSTLLDERLSPSSLANIAGGDQTTLFFPCCHIDRQFGFRPDLPYTALSPVPENSLDQALELPTEGDIMLNASDYQPFDANNCYTSQLFDMFCHDKWTSG